MAEIIDINCMVGKSGVPRPDWPASAAETVEALRRVGIDRALVTNFASLQYDPVDGAEDLARELLVDEGSLLGCPVAVPHWAGDAPEPKVLLDGYIERGWRAFRIYPRTHYFLLHPLVCGPLMEEAQARSFPIVIERDQFDWPELIGILEAFPRLNLVVCGEGYREIRTILPLLERYEGLRFDTSWMQQFMLYETVVDRLGPRPLVFGSKFPMFEPGASLTPVLRAPISEDAREAILGGNAAAMLSAAH